VEETAKDPHRGLDLGGLGAVVVSVLLQVLNTVSSQPGPPPTAAPIIQYAAYGSVLIVALLFLPRGVVPSVASLGTRRRQESPA
jgi:branched-chain amino acid transport system permease protein